MKHQKISCACALACVSLWVVTATAMAARPHFAPLAATQDKKKDNDKGKSEGADKTKGQAAGVNVSADEGKALKKIQDASNATAKLQAAGEYVKKFPKSAKRPEVANYLAGQVHGTQDAAQRITLGETYMTVFNDPTENDIITPVLIDAYVDAKRYDDAFRVAGPYLEKHPNEVGPLVRLTLAGAGEAVRNNTKFVEQSRRYGTKAVALIESDQKPEAMDAARWQEYKTRWLPATYREMGVLALRSNSPADAKAMMEKAVALKSDDPLVYAILGNMGEDEYTAIAKQYQSTHAAATLTQAQAQMDKVIVLYAQAVGLAGDKPEFKQLRDQIRPGLENYFKFRHGGSATGLEELIAKYKPAAAQ